MRIVLKMIVPKRKGERLCHREVKDSSHRMKDPLLKFFREGLNLVRLQALEHWGDG